MESLPWRVRSAGTIWVREGLDADQVKPSRGAADAAGHDVAADALARRTLAMAHAWFGGTKEESLADLIARKKYGKAIEVLRSQFREGLRDPRMRLQLADVLVLAGRPKEAMPILSTLADEFAREGYAAKAIAVLKRLEKIAPGRADVERRLAELIHKRLGSAAAPSLRRAGDEIGIEDLGIADAFASLSPPPVEAGPQESVAPAEGVFEEEFFDALQDMIEAGQAPAGGASALGSLLEDTAASRPQIVSPLFGGFSEDELSAVIAKFRLLSYEAGDIVVSEGQPGDSLFVLTTGALKAFVRDRAGRNVLVREMPEGSFFGEVSILSGKPRTATVTCAGRCELLELDLPALQEIVARHPHVREVIQGAYQSRAGSEEETRARAGTSSAAAKR